MRRLRQRDDRCTRESITGKYRLTILVPQISRIKNNLVRTIAILVSSDKMSMFFEQNGLFCGVSEAPYT